MVSKKAAPKKAKSKKVGERYKSFRLARRADKPVTVGLPSSWWLAREVCLEVKTNWKLFLGLAAIYAITYKMLVLSLIRVDVAGIRQLLIELNESRISQLNTLFSASVGTAITDEDGRARLYASILTLLFTLCIVWAMRQVAMGRTIKIRDALYSGTSQFFAFITSLLIIFAQAIPMAVGFFIYATARVNNILNGGVEDLAVFMVSVLLTTLSLYWMVPTIISLVAVTVPGMYPLAAHKVSRELVAYRRMSVFWRLFMATVMVAVVWIIVLLLFVASGFVAFLAPEIIDILRGATLLFGTLYAYKLYRALLVK